MIFHFPLNILLLYFVSGTFLPRFLFVFGDLARNQKDQQKQQDCKFGVWVQYNLMRTQLDLTQAVERFYGKSLEDNSTPSSEWHFFAPYCSLSSSKPLYFRLLELPASYHTSQEICANAQQKFGDVLHKVQFLFLERSFQSCVYLVKADENILTVRSLIKLRKEAGEHVEEELIFKFLKFISLLEDHKYSKQFGFDLDQIGLDAKGEFILANYELYFKEPQQETRNLNRDTRRILESLIMLSEDSFNLMDLYSRAQEEYGETMMRLVQKCMRMEFKTSEAMTIIETSRDSDDRYSRGTLTDSYISDMDRLEETLGDHSFSQGPSFTKIKKNSKIKKCQLAVISFLFLMLIAGIGFVAFKYLEHRPVVCEEAQYYDKEVKKCMGCSMGCQRCVNGKTDQCFSCKGDLFLVMANYTDRLGYCSQNCQGLVVVPKTCIYQA